MYYLCFDFPNTALLKQKPFVELISVHISQAIECERLSAVQKEFTLPKPMTFIIHPDIWFLSFCIYLLVRYFHFLSKIDFEAKHFNNSFICTTLKNQYARSVYVCVIETEL